MSQAMTALDERVRAELETKQREPNLVRIMARLKEEDPLFSHNVPAHVQRSFSDQDLEQWLEKTYSVRAFVVESPEYVKSHLQIHDRVVLKEDFVEYEWLIAKYTEGEVIKKNDQKTVIKFDPGGKIIVDDDLVKNLEINARRRKAGDSPYHDKINVHPNINPQSVNELHKGQFVKCKNEVSKFKFRIPAGTDGVTRQVWGMEEKKLEATWAYTPGMEGDSSLLNNHTFSAEEVTLVRPNFIDYEKICKEIYEDRSR